MIFFYAWYFVMVIVVLNIITAFLLDDFTVMRAQIADEENGVISEWLVTSSCGSNHRVRVPLTAIFVAGNGG